MKRIAKFILLPLLVLTFLTTTFAANNKLTAVNTKNKEIKEIIDSKYGMYGFETIHSQEDNLTLVFKEPANMIDMVTGTNIGARKGGGLGALVWSSVNSSQDYKQVEVSVNDDAFKHLVEGAKSEEIYQLELTYPLGGVRFLNREDIASLGNGEFKFKIKRQDKSILEYASKEFIGDRPIVNFDASVNNKPIGTLTGSMKIEIPYQAKADEDTNQLVLYKIDEFGRASKVKNASYKQISTITSDKHFSVQAQVNELGTYAIGYDDNNKDLEREIPRIIVNNNELSVGAVYEESDDKNTRVLVPLRPIFESLGTTVEYDSASKIITAKQGEKTIILKVNDKIANVGGQDMRLDVPAKIIKARTFVPVRFISESLGASVEWLNADKTVHINLEKNQPPAKTQIDQFWYKLVDLPEMDVETDVYWRHISDDIVEKVDKLIEEYGVEVLFKGLKSRNVYSQYYSINKLVEYYNDDHIRNRAIDEITPFLTSPNDTLKEGAKFAISILSKEFDNPYIIKNNNGLKIFALFNDYSEYGSYNELWTIKDDELSKLHSFKDLQVYIARENPIILSPDHDKITVRTSSRKSVSLNVIDLDTGRASPEIMKLAVEKVATDNPDYNNTYPDGSYSDCYNVKWIDNDTVAFDATLAYNAMEIMEEVRVKYNFSDDSLQIVK